jgi:hypothetical protein
MSVESFSTAIEDLEDVASTSELISQFLNGMPDTNDGSNIEVLFDVPVILLCPAMNIKGPIPDRAIYHVDGSDESYKNTRVIKPEQVQERRIALLGGTNIPPFCVHQWLVYCR